MDILAYVSIGILVGWVTGYVVHGRSAARNDSMMNDVTVGIVGSLAGGFMFGALNIPGNVYWRTIGACVVGALVFLVVTHLVVAAAGLGRRRLQH